jgi:hypothetical protein
VQFLLPFGSFLDREVLEGHQPSVVLAGAASRSLVSLTRCYLYPRQVVAEAMGALIEVSKLGYCSPVALERGWVRLRDRHVLVMKSSHRF